MQNRSPVKCQQFKGMPFAIILRVMLSDKSKHEQPFDER